MNNELTYGADRQGEVLLYLANEFMGVFKGLPAGYQATVMAAGVIGGIWLADRAIQKGFTVKDKDGRSVSFHSMTV